ncbi:MAG: hypothetical protein ABI290_07485 [Ginsengibacter sp.]
MKTTKLIFSTIFLFVIVLTGCKKEIVEGSNDIEFCGFVSAEEYNKSSTAIDKYLTGLDNNLSETKKLGLFRDWLKAKSCVTNAEILCVSCIDTNPPQSEIRVTFLVNGKSIEKTLDIIMDKPLRFGNFHD